MKARQVRITVTAHTPGGSVDAVALYYIEAGDPVSVSRVLVDGCTACPVELSGDIITGPGGPVAEVVRANGRLLTIVLDVVNGQISARVYEGTQPVELRVDPLALLIDADAVKAVKFKDPAAPRFAAVRRLFGE